MDIIISSYPPETNISLLLKSNGGINITKNYLRGFVKAPIFSRRTFPAYIYNVLVITKKDFADHLNDLEKVLQKLVEAELKVNL